MDESRSSPETRVVLGFLLLGCAFLGFAAVGGTSLDVQGRGVPPDTGLAVLLALIGAATLAVAVALAVRHFGVREAVKLIGREAWPAFLFGAGGGAMIGFFLRAIFPGPTILVALVAAYGGGAYLVLWFAQKDSPQAMMGDEDSGAGAALRRYVLPKGRSPAE